MELDVFHLFLWEPIAFEGSPFEINRVVLLMYVAALACILFFLLGTRRRGPVPRGMNLVTETGYLFVRNNIAIDVIGPEGARYAPLLASMFFFIFFSNLLEIVPGINFPVTSRMALPALLALVSWVVFNFVGIKKQGLGHYLRGTLFPPGVPWPVYILLTPIEFFSVFVIRPLTLAIRLFANMLAGHVLLTVFFLFTENLLESALENPLSFPDGLGFLLGILTFLVACLLVVFELMVITIQAYIFTTLTAFYIAEGLHGHGEADHEADHTGSREHETEGIEVATTAPAS